MDTGFFALIGVGVGYFLSWFQHRKDRLDKYQLAIIDKKLSVAQEAFQQSLHLRKVIHADAELQMGRITQAQDWWNKNCLFLAPDIRRDFIKIINAVFDYQTELEEFHRKIRETDDEKEREQLRADIKGKFSEIVGLPGRIQRSIDKYYIQDNSTRLTGLRNVLKSIWTRMA